jgi:molybdopterin converting factor small subunit
VHRRAPERFDRSDGLTLGMKVRVQFFSRLRDLAGLSEMDLEVPEGAKIDDLLDTLYLQTPALREWDKSILVASGLEFVGRDYVVKPNDQISIMPPVQGG